MLQKSILLLPALLLAAACNPTGDRDEDGLTNAEERELGTKAGKWDSDGDGYGDFDEAMLGSDPDDASSLLYDGYWPYQPEKHLFGTPTDDFSGSHRRGDPIPRVVGHDQFGNEVDLYDFAGHGKPVLVDVSAEWCPPCQFMAAWLDHEPGTEDSYLDEYDNVRQAVDAGEVYWITFMAENDNYGNPGPGVPRRWYEAYPHPDVPVLADRNKRFTGWMDLQAFPTTMWVNTDMTLEAYAPADNTRGLERLSEFLGN